MSQFSFYKDVVYYKYHATTDIVTIQNAKLYTHTSNGTPPIYSRNSYKQAKYRDNKDGTYTEFQIVHPTSPGYIYDIAATEGKIYKGGGFWLKKRNDKRARKIIEDYLESRKRERKPVLEPITTFFRKDLGKE